MFFFQITPSEAWYLYTDVYMAIYFLTYFITDKYFTQGYIPRCFFKTGLTAAFTAIVQYSSSLRYTMSYQYDTCLLLFQRCEAWYAVQIHTISIQSPKYFGGLKD